MYGVMYKLMHIWYQNSRAKTRFAGAKPNLVFIIGQASSDMWCHVSQISGPRTPSSMSPREMASRKDLETSNGDGVGGFEGVVLEILEYALLGTRRRL